MAYDFDKIAKNYDRLNLIMTLGFDRRWRRHAVKSLGLHPTDIVLDVACGTGDMAEELHRVGDCKVFACDISDEMLAVARQKSKGTNVYEKANAEELPYGDAFFDAVTCAFGIRNFINLEKGLQEMVRVLKVGGKMAILEMATPDCSIIKPFYNLYTRRIIPWLGNRFAGNREAYTYLPTSIERFPKGKTLMGILELLGLKVKQHKYMFGVCRLYLCNKILTTGNTTLPTS